MAQKWKYSILVVAGLTLLSVFSHRAWLDFGAILTNGDVWYLFRESMMTANWGTWTSVLSLGETNVSYNYFLLTLVWQLVSKLGFSYQLANQLVYFFPTIFITPVVTYFYLLKLSRSEIASAVGSLTYMFTTIFLMMQNGGLLLAVSYAILPLIFWLLHRFLEKSSLVRGLLFVLVISISLFYELRITYITLFVVMSYVVAYFLLKYGKKSLPTFVTFLKNSLVPIIALLAINIYIYAPLVFTSIKESASTVATRGLFGVNFFTIKEPLVLMHPFWSGKVPTEFVPQPIPGFYWIFPLAAFAALFYAKKQKFILLFYLIALTMVFLGKSAADPAGWIYTWLYYNFPGFGFFREPSKFWPMMAFSYVVLISYTVKYTLEKITSLKLGQGYKLILKIGLLVPLVLLPVYIGRPAFTGELGPLFVPKKMSDSHHFFKDFLYDQEDFFRTMFLPGRYRLGFWSEIHPMLGINEIAQEFQSLSPKITELLGVKYVVLTADETDDVYRIWGKKEIYKRIISQSTDLRRLDDPRFGGFEVYETPGYLPKFYAPNTGVFVNSGDRSTLREILDLSSYQSPMVFFRSANISVPGSADEKRLLADGGYVNSISRESYMTARCVRCEDRNYRHGLVYPFPRFLPDSFLYSYALNKEQKSLDKVVADTKEHLRLAVFYATKRTAEFQAITDRGLHQEFLKNSIGEHDKLINLINKDVNKLSVSYDDNDYLLTILDYLDTQRETIYTIITSADKVNTENSLRLKSCYERLLALMGKISDFVWVSDLNSAKYLVDVPEAGKYNIFLQGAGTSSSALVINDNKFEPTASDQDNWIRYQSVPLVAGLNSLAAYGTKANLAGQQSLSITVPSGAGEYLLKIPVARVEPNTEYIVSTDYKISLDTKSRFYTARDTDFEQSGVVRRSTDQYLRATNEWHEIKDKFTTRLGEQDITLNLSVTRDANPHVIDLANIKVVKNKGPLLVIKADKIPDIQVQPPRLTFQWINPTKYLVHVENSQGRFPLVFLESYHAAWEAYYVGNQPHASGKIVAANERWRVSEMAPKNDLDLFSFLAPYKDKYEKVSSHISVNGYANAWIVDRTGSFDLVIEYAPQRTFTLSLIMSVSALLVVVGVVIWRLKYDW